MVLGATVLVLYFQNLSDTCRLQILMIGRKRRKRRKMPHS